jgi:hypothetical protein
VIRLDLSNMMRESSVAALVERGAFDRLLTHGERVFWQGDPKFTEAKILAMAAQSGGRPQANVMKNEEASPQWKRKKARILAICGAFPSCCPLLPSSFA